MSKLLERPFRNDEVLWYVATRRDSGAHFILSEVYIAEYEREFERIREYNTVEEARDAYTARIAEDEMARPKRTVKVSKVRGEIRKGETDEGLRARLREEIRMELLNEMNEPVTEKKAPARKTAAKDD